MAAPAADRLLEMFLAMLAAERNAARNTLLAYRADLLDFLSQHGADAQADDCRAHLAGLAAAGLSARSQARKLSAMRQFFRFLAREGLRGHHIWEELAAQRKDVELYASLKAELEMAQCSFAPNVPVKAAALAAGGGARATASAAIWERVKAELAAAEHA